MLETQTEKPDNILLDELRRRLAVAPTGIQFLEYQGKTIGHLLRVNQSVLGQTTAYLFIPANQIPPEAIGQFSKIFGSKGLLSEPVIIQNSEGSAIFRKPTKQDYQEVLSTSLFSQPTEDRFS